MEKRNQTHSKDIIINAVGDISFEGRLANKPDIAVFSDVKSILQACDLVIANLENPLTVSSKRVVNKCTLRGDPGWAAVLKETGINFVSLANNHIMDYGPEGLFDTIKALDLAGINHLGAGKDKEEACSPLFLTIKGIRLAFLARSAVIVESPSYAGSSTPGVAFLDVYELKERISQCRKEADLIIIILHWGLEEYSYPTPTQVDLAGQLILAGADGVVGHHPHVIQGIQNTIHGLIAYSLGNFLFDEFSWNVGQGTCCDIKFTLTEMNRKGIILQMLWRKDGLADISQTFTRIDSKGIVRDVAVGRTKDFNRLSLTFNSSWYPWWWLLYSVWCEWNLRVKTVINPSRIIRNIWKIRPRHINELIITIKKSTNIIKGKSTNPYD